MNKLFLLVFVAVIALSVTGCASNLDKLSWLKDDPADVDLTLDRNGLKLKRTNTGAITNRVTFTEDEKAKIKKVLDAK